MLARKLVLALSLFTAGIGTALADAHTVSYGAKAAALGATITLAGQDFVMVRIPFRTFTGEKYYIFAPAPLEDPFGGGTISIITSHDTRAFSPNININNVPARVSVQDTRSYSLSGDIGTDAQFVVQAAASESASRSRLATRSCRLARRSESRPALRRSRLKQMSAPQPISSRSQRSRPIRIPSSR